MKTHTLLWLSFFITICLSAQDFDVPKDYKFEKKEDYKSYEPQVKQAINWALNNTLSADAKKRVEVNTFFMAWVSGTPDVTVGMDSKIVTFIKYNSELLMPFIMGWVQFSLDNNYSKDKIMCNKAGIETVVAFYNKNRGFLKKDKEVEKYEKLISNGKLEEELAKKLK